MSSRGNTPPSPRHTKEQNQSTHLQYFQLNFFEAAVSRKEMMMVDPITNYSVIYNIIYLLVLSWHLLIFSKNVTEGRKNRKISIYSAITVYLVKWIIQYVWVSFLTWSPRAHFFSWWQWDFGAIDWGSMLPWWLADPYKL